MRNYSDKISLTKNSRGIYSLDTSMGCKSGMNNEAGGCYGDCYAAKSAKLYGYDFGNTILRFFKDKKHKQSIVNKINNIKLDFVRIGTNGDPSENWQHTIDVLKEIKNCNKEIVIITKHWTNLTNEQLLFLKTINVCINTSVSALDKKELLKNSLKQYNRLKPFCSSVLRIVSCDFNLENSLGKKLYKLQNKLFENENTIDTILRINKKNKLVTQGILKITESTFLGKKATISRFKKNTYFGKCSKCHEMCGTKIDYKNVQFPKKRTIPKQLLLFNKKEK